MAEMRSQETKLDQSTMQDLSEKDMAVSHAIACIRGKVGGVSRSGDCRLLGGYSPRSYAVPDAGAMAPIKSPRQMQDEHDEKAAQANPRATVPQMMEAERPWMVQPNGPSTSALM